MGVRRYSSRRQRLDRSFLTERLQGARQYDRIAGYFSSSLFEAAGEALETVSGPSRIVCNSDLHPLDVQTAKAAKIAVWRLWAVTETEELLEGGAEDRIRSQPDRKSVV